MGMGQYIKSLAKEKGMTLQQLAEQADVSINTVYGIIKRDSETVSPKIAAKLALALDIPVHYLTQDEETRKLAADLTAEMESCKITLSDLSGFTHISKERLQRMLSGQTKISPIEHEVIEQAFAHLGGSNYHVYKVIKAYLKLNSAEKDDSTVKYKSTMTFPNYVKVLNNLHFVKGSTSPLRTAQYSEHPMLSEKFRTALKAELEQLKPHQLQTVVDIILDMNKANRYDRAQPQPNAKEQPSEPVSSPQTESADAVTESMDKAVENLKDGNVSEPIDLSDF